MLARFIGSQIALHFAKLCYTHTHTLLYIGAVRKFKTYPTKAPHRLKFAQKQILYYMHHMHACGIQKHDLFAERTSACAYIFT